MKNSIAIALPLLMSLFATAGAETGKAAVSEGKTVKVNYVLHVDGKAVDRSESGKPLEFKFGSNQMIPGFEKGVRGMKVGQKKTFSVRPEEGYGKLDPRNKMEVPKSKLPPNVRPGMTIYNTDMEKKRSIPCKVLEFKNDKAVVDCNNPLAGKTLNFDVEIVEIR